VLRGWLLPGFAFGLAFACACGGPPPRTAQSPDDSVPANSIEMSRIHDDGRGPAAPDGASSPEEDPTQPYTVPLSGDPNAAALSKGAPPAEPSAPAKKGPKVSPSECNKALDRYLELEFATNPQLKQVPAEMRQQIIEQAKAQALQERGAAPCDATRSQYTCAMSATTTTGWQTCMR
jgi:hypothetical protein